MVVITLNYMTLLVRKPRFHAMSYYQFREHNSRRRRAVCNQMSTAMINISPTIWLSLWLSSRHFAMYFLQIIIWLASMNDNQHVVQSSAWRQMPLYAAERWNIGARCLPDIWLMMANSYAASSASAVKRGAIALYIGCVVDAQMMLPIPQGM